MKGLLGRWGFRETNLIDTAENLISLGVLTGDAAPSYVTALVRRGTGLAMPLTWAA